MNISLRIHNRAVLSVAVLAFLAMGASAQSDEVLTLDIKPQNADSALVTLAKSSGVQIILADGAGADVEVKGLQGEYRFDEALAALTTEAGLTHEYTAENLVVVQEAEQVREPEAAGKAQPDEEESPLELREQTVTGTRLKGVDPASPRITITREQIERGGYASIEDVLRNLPQNLGSANATATQLFQGEFGGSRVPFGATLGASGINLRGLGTRSSLVLINGRRKARSSLDVQDLLTDTSSIPMAQIERIEIITDGASAIYGADAVAGVLNVILRDDYDGLSLGVRTETASNDASRDRIDLGHTFSWDSGYFTTSVNLEQTEPTNPNKLIRVGPDGVGDFTDVGGVNRRNYGIGPAGQGSVLAVNAIVRPWGTTRYAGDHLDGPNPFLPRDPATGDILGPRDPSVPSAYNEEDLGPEVQRYSVRFNGEQRFGESQTLEFRVRLRQSAGRQPHRIQYRELQRHQPGLLAGQPAGSAGRRRLATAQRCVQLPVPDGEQPEQPVRPGGAGGLRHAGRDGADRGGGAADRERTRKHVRQPRPGRRPAVRWLDLRREREPEPRGDCFSQLSGRIWRQRFDKRDRGAVRSVLGRCGGGSEQRRAVDIAAGHK